MAFTSFTLRNTISNNGSALRRTNVTQDSTTPDGSGTAVFDSGLRSDGFFLPVPSEYLESTFSVNVYRRDEVDLEWTIATPLVDIPLTMNFEPVELLIRASSTGEPVTANDGSLVRSYVYGNYEESFVDTGKSYIVDGGWIYYSLFLKYADSTGDAFYEKVADLSIQIPINFGSTENLWKRIPTYYRELDNDYVNTTPDYPYSDGPLYRFIDLFGWEMDRIRTTIYDTMRINDPDVVHSSAIDSLANQTGVEFGKNSLGTTKLRSILNNIGYLRRSKGTQDSVEAYISALSGCGVSVTNDIKETVNTDNMFGYYTDVAYGNGRWVVVGYNGVAKTSTDGVTWTGSYGAVGNAQNLYRIAYGNGKWVAGGGSSGELGSPYMYTSTDGTTWTAVLTAPTTGSYSVQDVVYDNGVWVAVCRSTNQFPYNRIYTSTDAITWTLRTLTIVAPDAAGSVAYGNGQWIAAFSLTDTTDRYIAKSIDNGITWSPTSVSPSSNIGLFFDIDYTNGSWFIIGANLRSTDDGVTWTQISTAEYGVSRITHNNNTFYKDMSGGILSSDDGGLTWTTFKSGLGTEPRIAFSEIATVIVDRSFDILYISPIINFNVHPMRVNLFADPLFSQGETYSGTVGNITKVYTELSQDSRNYGWGVITVQPESITTSNIVDITGDTVTITLSPGTGTSDIYIYSRCNFTYNNNLIYYASAESTHDFALRFFADDSLPALELPYATSIPSLFDSWNNSVSIGNFPKFSNTTRIISGSIPNNSSVVTTNVLPTYKLQVAHSATENVVVVFKNPLIEYKNFSGEFFTGSTPMGGFIPNANIEGNPSAGLYDYHWGQNATGDPGKDFSFYTLDFQRSKSVTEDIVSKNIMPVTLVKGFDYSINWEVLE